MAFEYNTFYDMRKVFITLCLAVSALGVSAQDNPRIATMDLTASELAHYMSPGWNLGNTMEAGNNANVFTDNGGLNTEVSWQHTRTTQDIINLVKENGFKSIRIPTAWVMGHIADSDNLTIDEAWLNRVKEIVDYCINANLYVVLNDHWDGGWLEYDGFTTGADVSAKKEQLRKLWTNIATAFRDYDERLIFAGLNEPGVGGASPQASGSKLGTSDLTARLLEYEQVFIDAVRATGGNNARRVLVVQGPNTSISDTYSLFDASKLTDSADRRLMVEVHHYDPYQFCGMTADANWGSMWFYWYGHAPRRGSSTRTAPQSQQTAIQTNFNHMKAKFVDNGIPVIVGEYGANHRTLSATQGTQASHDESIQYWYNFSTDYAMRAGCIPFAWDTNYIGAPHMTIFNRATTAVYDSYILNGIKEGSASALSAYNAIYPEPSTATGVASVLSRTTAAPADVYDLSGRKVASQVANPAALSLPKGVYIYQGRKVVVK